MATATATTTTITTTSRNTRAAQAEEGREAAHTDGSCKLRVLGLGLCLAEVGAADRGLVTSSGKQTRDSGSPGGDIGSSEKSPLGYDAGRGSGVDGLFARNALSKWSVAKGADRQPPWTRFVADPAQHPLETTHGVHPDASHSCLSAPRMKGHTGSGIVPNYLRRRPAQYMQHWTSPDEHLDTRAPGHLPSRDAVEPCYVSTQPCCAYLEPLGSIKRPLRCEHVDLICPPLSSVLPSCDITFSECSSVCHWAKCCATCHCSNRLLKAGT